MYIIIVIVAMGGFYLLKVVFVFLASIRFLAPVKSVGLLIWDFPQNWISWYEKCFTMYYIFIESMYYVRALQLYMIKLSFGEKGSYMTKLKKALYCRENMNPPKYYTGNCLLCTCCWTATKCFAKCVFYTNNKAKSDVRKMSKDKTKTTSRGLLRCPLNWLILVWPVYKYLNRDMRYTFWCRLVIYFIILTFMVC